MAGATCQEWVNVDTVTRSETKNVLANSLDFTRNVETENTRQFRKWHASSAGDDIVRVWYKTACLNFDQDILGARNRLFHCACDKRLVDLDEAGNSNVWHAVE
jgi:hypothetical protein